MKKCQILDLSWMDENVIVLKLDQKNKAFPMDALPSDKWE